jgi:hypothetical protein
MAENIGSIENPLVSRQGLSELVRSLVAGRITARITTTEALADAGALLELLRRGGVHGKAVIRMGSVVTHELSSNARGNDGTSVENNVVGVAALSSGG